MHLEYKWIVLINTTTGMLMVSINQTIAMMALPAIFGGLHVNPLAPGQSSLLLWVMLSYSAVTTVLLVTLGRIGDMVGRVRLYNAGFAIFTLGSLLCAMTPSNGSRGVGELIAFRMLQGIGGACLFANSTAILTDAFPVTQRGFSMGFNQLAFLGGNVVGVVGGGLLATINWRLDFLISVPVGIVGTIWAYVSLREIGQRHVEPPDWLGNITFAVGLLSVMVGLSLTLSPYAGQALGWSNPVVLGLLGIGLLSITAFVVVERRAKFPMFNLALFRIRPFLFGNLAGFLFALSRGGLTFMLIVWLQGIWLPIHGVRYQDTPLQAGLDNMPMMFGFIAAGPAAGWLSDRYGARILGTVGLLLSATGPGLLMWLPANFSLLEFGVCIFISGVGMGLFSAPNLAQVMNAVPAAQRGAAAGMRQTLQNAGMTISQVLFFTIMISNLARSLQPGVRAGAMAAGLPSPLADALATVPPGAAIFAAMLGYDPVASFIPASALAALPEAVRQRILDPHFFAGLLATPFVASLHVALAISALMCVLGAGASWLRGRRTPQLDPSRLELPHHAVEPAPSSAGAGG